MSPPATPSTQHDRCDVHPCSKEMKPTNVGFPESRHTQHGYKDASSDQNQPLRDPELSVRVFHESSTRTCAKEFLRAPTIAGHGALRSSRAAIRMLALRSWPHPHRWLAIRRTRTTLRFLTDETRRTGAHARSEEDGKGQSRSLLRRPARSVPAAPAVENMAFNDVVSLAGKGWEKGFISRLGSV